MWRRIHLRAGLLAGEIIPFFQPLVNLSARRIEGFEVLARWQHPLRGLVEPSEFIPLAEETGIIGAITETILDQAFIAMEPLPEQLGLSVNISPVQLHDRRLATMVKDIARRHQFALNRLTVEVTESAIVKDLEQTRILFQELHDLGVRLSLDDFGTGYSSLQHLDSLPFDELKVDRRFVEEINSNRSTRKIAAAIVGLGQSLGLATVAEGIDDASQADRLLWLGCDVGQGYFFGRPVPSSELMSTIAAYEPAPPAVAEEAAVETEDLGRVDTLPVVRFAQLEAIFGSAPVGLCYLDNRFRYLNINQRMADLHGVAIADHLGRSAQELFPACFEQAEQHLRRALAGEAVKDEELLLERPDHPEGDATLLVYYQPARDDTGDVMGVSVIAVDITDRKRMEQALRRSEEELRHTVDFTPHILWSRDGAGELTSMSKQWQELTGLTFEQTVGDGWLKVVHPEDIEPTLERVRSAMETGGPFDAHFRIRSKTGVYRWMRGRGTPRREADGTIVAWHGVLEDVHEATIGGEQERPEMSRQPLGMIA